MKLQEEAISLIDDYSKACTEVIEILKFFPKSQYEKIPLKEIEYYMKNSDKQYKFTFDPNIPFEEQKILRTTYAILVTIYRDFFLTHEKRSVLKDVLILNKKIKNS